MDDDTPITTANIYLAACLEEILAAPIEMQTTATTAFFIGLDLAARFPVWAHRLSCASAVQVMGAEPPESVVDWMREYVDCHPLPEPQREIERWHVDEAQRIAEEALARYQDMFARWARVE